MNISASHKSPGPIFPHSIPVATLKDVDCDGDLKLLVKLDAEALSRHEIDALCVLGTLTYDGYVASGFDTIQTVPKKNHISKKK